MIDNKQNNFRIAYLVMSVLFVLAVIFNEYIGIAGIRPDMLLIILLYVAFNEKAIIAITAAFVFGFLQDVFLPGSIQYWGLSPLFKTLLIYILIKLLPFVVRLRGIAFQLSVFGSLLVYNIFYNLLYYSGYAKPLTILLRYSFPETFYTFLILLLLNMVFPLNSKNG
jgi:rod shape-determining protein MreD